MMGDTPIMIRKEDPEMVHCESYDWVPQWVYIHGMSPGMFANALTSTLGLPLHAEYSDTASQPHCL